MRQKHLESRLSQLQREFPNPQIALEQYPTSPPLAAAVIQYALQAGHVGPGRTVCDLGCGTGMLATAAAWVASDTVTGVDCDADALAVAAANADLVEVDHVMEWIQARVKNVSAGESSFRPPSRRGGRGGGGGRGKGRGKGRGRRGPPPNRASTPEARQLIVSDDDGLPLQSNCVDTVLTNPPFGTKANAGMDLRFLRTATRLSRHVVYSFHKTSTRAFVLRQVQSWNMTAEVVAEMRFDIPQTYAFHAKKSVDVAVDLIRVFVGPDTTDTADDDKGRQHEVDDKSAENAQASEPDENPLDAIDDDVRGSRAEPV